MFRTPDLAARFPDPDDAGMASFPVVIPCLMFRDVVFSSIVLTGFRDAA
ncbi:hypothetical protein GOB93_08475 [Acetobacter musti]|uniref:Uncharacterized protein n=1 Tax=Acetobacter musti TaxID=864732 RepID=A0ABX0JRL9_9PROT|nr:hypothetical protein [Acetobacter musti]NHN84678.1 hypothetical protein [Acetobacter musti]